jgi:hypothetical protein
MMKQKVVISREQTIINDYIKKGWKVQSVTSQCVSTGGSSLLRGDFCFILEKEV